MHVHTSTVHIQYIQCNASSSSTPTNTPECQRPSLDGTVSLAPVCIATWTNGILVTSTHIYRECQTHVLYSEHMHIMTSLTSILVPSPLGKREVASLTECRKENIVTLAQHIGTYECCVMDVPEVALLGIQLHVGQYSLSSIKHTVFERSSYVPTIIIFPSRCTFRNLETAINIVEFPFFHNTASWVDGGGSKDAIIHQ